MLENLPNEILCEIVKYLSIEDIRNIMKLNNELELRISGMWNSYLGTKWYLGFLKEINSLHEDLFSSETIYTREENKPRIHSKKTTLILNPIDPDNPMKLQRRFISIDLINLIQPYDKNNLFYKDIANIIAKDSNNNNVVTVKCLGFIYITEIPSIVSCIDCLKAINLKCEITGHTNNCFSYDYLPQKVFLRGQDGSNIPLLLFNKGLEVTSLYYYSIKGWKIV